MGSKVRVRIPATSANLGAGFDALGVAIELYNEIELEEYNGIKIESMDSVSVPTDESNLIYQIVKKMYTLQKKPFAGISIKQWNNIPFSRGLGSSSACIVGGLVGANHLLGAPYSTYELLNLATEIEGHPDNVAPALLGGMTCSVMDDGKVHYVREDLARDITFVVIIPDTELATSVARAALPEMVTHKDARYNLSRAALMALSLKDGVYKNLKYGAQDRLHQPYRFPYIEKGAQVVGHCYELGAYAAMISGAGSTLLSIVDAKNQTFISSVRDYLNSIGLTGWKVEGYFVDNKGTQII